jgi:hypothetical protein
LKRKFGGARTDFVDFAGNSCSIDQKSGEIWTVQTDLQQIYPKSGRLLEQKAAMMTITAAFYVRGGRMNDQGLK